MGLFNMRIVALSLIGLLCSAYAYSVEMKAERAHQMGTEYRAACDVGPFSCTRVFSSEYGSASQFLGLPKISNALLGIIFYFSQMVLSCSPLLSVLMSAQSIVVTVCLLYILIFILHDVCVVCGTMYVVNISVFIISYRWWNRTKAEGVRAGSAAKTKTQ